MKWTKEAGILVIKAEGRAIASEFISVLKEAMKEWGEGKLLLIFDARDAVFDPTLEEQRMVSLFLRDIQKERGIKAAVVLAEGTKQVAALIPSLFNKIYEIPTGFFEDMPETRDWILSDQEVE